MAELSYCILCGNEKTAAKDGIGVSCRALIKGKLSKAYSFWKECGERNSRCCGSIATEKDHIFFHGEGWEVTYQPEGMPELRTSVEMGVSFFNDQATTYYIYDADSFTESFEYGDVLLYPDKLDDPEFWGRLEKQLDGAAEAAWNSDVLSCRRCGYNYNASGEDCPCEEVEEGEEVEGG